MARWSPCIRRCEELLIYAWFNRERKRKSKSDGTYGLTKMPWGERSPCCRPLAIQGRKSPICFSFVKKINSKIFSNFAESLLNMLHGIASKDPPAFKISQFSLPQDGGPETNFSPLILNIFLPLCPSVLISVSHNISRAYFRGGIRALLMSPFSRVSRPR